jgi:hypothetical protein
MSARKVDSLKLSCTIVLKIGMSWILVSLSSCKLCSPRRTKFLKMHCNQTSFRQEITKITCSHGFASSVRLVTQWAAEMTCSLVIRVPPQKKNGLLFKAPWPLCLATGKL